MTRYETARLTADVVVLADDDTRVLLVRRAKEPYIGRWALPGGHLNPGEEAEAAARRELREETGIDPGHLIAVGVYATPGRDPRGRYVSFAYVTRLARTVPPTAGDDAADAQWVPVRAALNNLAFDHLAIITDALRGRAF